MAKRKPGEKVKETDPAILAFQAKEKERKVAAQKKRDEGGSRAKKVGNAAVKKNEAKRSAAKAKTTVAKKKAPVKAKSKIFLQRLIDKRKNQIKKATS
jgi:hypothetical protein